MKISNKLIVLDRDGVINQDSSEYIKSIEDWKLYDSAVEAIRVFNKLKYKVIIATNQSGISRGYYNVELLLKINILLQSKLYAVGAKIDSVFFFPTYQNINACVESLFQACSVKFYRDTQSNQIRYIFLVTLIKTF